MTFIIPDDIGRSRERFTVGALEEIRQQTQDQLIESLYDADRVSSGELAQSIKVDLVERDGGFSFVIRMDEYWKFVDKGVDGYEKSVGSPYKFKSGTKSIPYLAMRDFIANKGLSPTMNINRNKRVKAIKGDDKISKHLRKGVKKKNKEDALKSFAFAVGKSIKKKGIKPTGFYSDVVNDEWKALFTEIVSEAVGKDIKILFEDIKDSIGGQ